MENRIYAEKNGLWYVRGLFIAEHHSTSRRKKSRLACEGKDTQGT